MEKRTINQVKVFMLILTPIVGGKSEEMAAWSYSEEALQNYLDTNKHVWKHNNVKKFFKKDSILEWYNDFRWDTKSDLIESKWINEDEMKNIAETLKDSFIDDGTESNS